jgi:hypothetical protein
MLSTQVGLTGKPLSQQEEDDNMNLVAKLRLGKAVTLRPQNVDIKNLLDILYALMPGYELRVGVIDGKIAIKASRDKWSKADR